MSTTGGSPIFAPGWTRSTDGTLARPLDVVERWLFTRIERAVLPPGVEAEGLTVKLKLKLPRSIDAVPYLRRAWLLFRHTQPLIGAIYPPFSGRDEAGRYLVVLPPLDPEEWLRESFLVNEGSEAPYKDVEEAGRVYRPSRTAMAHWFPSSSHLVIRTTHLRIDGPGVCRAMKTFVLGLTSILNLGLDAPLGSYSTDVERPSLWPGLDYILGFPPEGNSATARAVSELMKHWHTGLYSLSLPIREGSDGAVPADTKHIDCVLDEDLLEAVVRACKRRGVSVSAAVHASIVRVCATFPQHREARNQLVTLIANLRPQLDPMWSTADFGLNVCCFIVPFCLEGGFNDLTRRMGAVYARDLSALPLGPAGDPVKFTDVLPYYADAEAAFLDTLPVEGCPPFRVPNLSSFGVLEKWMPPKFWLEGNPDPVCEIEDFQVVNQTADPTPEFQLWSFRGTMRMYLYYNEAYYTDKLMSTVMELVRENLLEQLGIRGDKRDTSNHGHCSSPS